MKCFILPLFCGIAGFVISGCDSTKDKTPLTGKREAVLAYEENLAPDPGPKSSLHVSQGTPNTRWAMASGVPSHAQSPLALGGDPKLLWEVSVGSGNGEDHRITATPVVDEARAYAVDGYGRLTAVDLKTGSVVWEFDPTPSEDKGEGFGGGVSVEGNTLYLTSAFGEIIALNSSDGKIKWRKKLSSPFRTSPTLANGNIYVVSINNEVHALSQQDGNVLWTHRGIAEAAGLLGGSSPAVSGNTVIATLSSGEVTALDAANGHPIWVETLTPSMGSDSVSGIAHIRARAIIDGNSVYVISHGGSFVALDLKTGRQKWSREISGLHSPALASDHIFLIDSDNRIIAVSAHTGTVRWIEPLPKSDQGTRIDWAGPIIAGGNLILTGTNGKAAFISPDNGRVIKEISLPDGSAQSPVVAQNTLFILTDDGKLAAYK